MMGKFYLPLTGFQTGEFLQILSQQERTGERAPQIFWRYCISLICLMSLLRVIWLQWCGEKSMSEVEHSFDTKGFVFIVSFSNKVEPVSSLSYQVSKYVKERSTGKHRLGFSIQRLSIIKCSSHECSGSIQPLFNFRQNR